MKYTYDEAKGLIYEKLLWKDGSREAIIFDDLSQETSFGWCFHYSSVDYHKTRDTRLQWTGPGRGLEVDHTTIYRWVMKFTPGLQKGCAAA
ncbi:MAG: hypothetical protein M3Q07_23200 [Pseudobdellovibrionaceae bacterium]|nr:hypothetical protein [Pseudobdellovibrionaceae bacterium]